MKSLYLALVEEKLCDCFQPENRTMWENERKKDCRDSSNFFASNVLQRSKIGRMY